MSWFSDIFKSRETIIREHEREKAFQKRLSELEADERTARFINYSLGFSPTPTLSRFDIPGDVCSVIYETRDFVAIPVWRVDDGGHKRDMCDILSKTGDFIRTTRNASWARKEIIRLQLSGETALNSPM